MISLMDLILARPLIQPKKDLTMVSKEVKKAVAINYH
jgi:hypothetical protein